MSRILSYDDIRNALPYRQPMLMLDRVKISDDGRAQGLKLLSMDEAFFQGHFPGHPIMPGVLQVEAMFQLCHLVVGKELDPQGTQDVFLQKLSRVKFRKPVTPGDRLILDAELVSKTETAAEFKATAKTAAGVSCQANITVSVRPKCKPDTFSEAFNAFDLSENVKMNTVAIMDTIPHRFPFLYADYVTEIGENTISVVKNLTGNEPIFHGYTQDYAVLPASVQCEFLAQTGAIKMLSYACNKGRIAYFASINEFEAFHPVFPGDQLVCESEVPDADSKFGRGTGLIKVDGKIVSRISLTFAIV